MTEQIAEPSTDTDAAIVQKLLYALRDKDLDTAGAQLSEPCARDLDAV